MADSRISPMSTPPLSRGSSFQRMLELERKYKLACLQSDPDVPDIPTFPSSEPLSPRLPLQNRRANSISQQQQDLMLKAARRSIAQPSLSIDIPSPKEDRSTAESRTRQRTQERRPQPAPEAEPELDLENVEPLHKSVKFLAPDSDEDESDQSSICQSPSWEGYGQKKKDKKKEAERKRKEKEKKEHAEREAKAAKKRASRLSKAPPPVVRPMPTVMERSNSAPVLDAHHLSASSRGRQLSTVEDEVVYATTASQQNFTTSPLALEETDMLDSASKRFVGGLKLQQEREAALQSAMHTQFVYAGGGEPRQRMHKSYSTGPGMDMLYQAASTGSSVREDSRSPRESLPPSSSRTHMLRHISAQQVPAKTTRGRDGKHQPATSSNYSSSNNSQELLQMAGVRGERVRTDSYVRRHREQSTERALAGFVDEQLVSSATARSSTRSSSQHTRRSSIGQEVKAAALKLAGQKPAAAMPAEPSDDTTEEQQHDYFASFDETHPAADVEVQLIPSPLSSPTTKTHRQEPTPLRVSQGPPGSNAPSISSSSGSGKTRSLREVARAALNIAPSTPAQSPVVKPTVKPPPYYLLRQRFSSSSSVPTISSSALVKTTSSTTVTQAAQPPKRAQNQPSSQNSAPPPNQPGNRVSEGSSSSSYDDGSSLPSPVTTPDTSRPQSANGIPVQPSAVPQAITEEAAIQDDARTLRQSSEAAERDVSEDVTPRMEKYEGADGMSLEDRWSRTAMAAEIEDTDAKSTVSDYADAEEMPSKTLSAPAKMQTKPGKKEDVQWSNGPGDPVGLPYHLTRQASEPDLLDRGTKKEPLVVSLRSDVKATPWSRARGQTTEALSTSGAEQKLYDAKQRPEKEEQSESEQKRRKLRKQQAVSEPKAEKEADEDSEVVDRTTDGSKPNMALTAANTSLFSARFMSPIGGLVPSYGFASHPFFVDLSDLNKTGAPSEQGTLPVTITATQITVTQAQAPEPAPAAAAAEILPQAKGAPVVLETAAKSVSARMPPPGEQRPTPALARSTTAPVSILKASPQQFSGPPRPPPPVLSAVPKHLQPASQQQTAVTESRAGPLAKMFVECCSCKFYHDMPSKLYECMAKPDAVVEDKLRGISGAITTMVKCPWCQHNMSTECCAGYAAVVYIKEKLH